MKDIIFNDLSIPNQNLLREANKVRKNAYAPYSKYSVGAAIITKSGEIYTGANMENASYGLTSCAEIGAIQSAISNGEKLFQAIAIVVCSSDNIGSPCGRCRQVIYEASELSKSDIAIILSNNDFSKIKLTSIYDLLPSPFGPEDIIANR